MTGRILADILANSDCVNLKDLCIAKDDLAWVLYCDIVCLDNDGCVLDAAFIALLAALKNRKYNTSYSLKCISVKKHKSIFKVKLPMVEYDIETKTYKVNENVHTKLPIKSCPVATSFMIFDE